MLGLERRQARGKYILTSSLYREHGAWENCKDLAFDLVKKVTFESIVKAGKFMMELKSVCSSFSRKEFLGDTMKLFYPF